MFLVLIDTPPRPWPVAQAGIRRLSTGVTGIGKIWRDGILPEVMAPAELKRRRSGWPRQAKALRGFAASDALSGYRQFAQQLIFERQRDVRWLDLLGDVAHEPKRLRFALVEVAQFGL